MKIQGKEEKAIENNMITFLDFLQGENKSGINYIKSGANESGYILDIEKLTGSKQVLGNGTDVDIYKIIENNGYYTVNYVDIDNNSKEIWKIESNSIDIQISTEDWKVTNGTKVDGVIIKVDKVIKDGEEIEINKIESVELSENEYKQMLLDEINNKYPLLEDREKLYVNLTNSYFRYNFKDMDELISEQIKMAEEEGESLPFANKSEFYTYIGGTDKFGEFIVNIIINNKYDLIGKYDDGILQKYTGAITTDPNGLKSSMFVATENGNYTFKVEIDGKEYTKTVTINNIEENSDNEKYTVDSIDFDSIGLKNEETGEFTTFSDAYIIYNKQLINIKNCIVDNQKIDNWQLVVNGILSNADVGSILNIILIKDGNAYCKNMKIQWPN